MALPFLLLPALLGLTVGAAEALLQGDALRGTALRVLRTQRGLSGAELARRAELSRPYLVQIERGERRAPKHTWTKILEALDATPDELERLVAAITSEQAKIAAQAKTHMRAQKALPARSVPARADASQPQALPASAPADVPEGQEVASATSAASVTEGSELLEGLLRRAARLEPAELRLLLAYCEALEAGAASRPEQQGRKCSVCGYRGHDKRRCSLK